MDGKRVTAEQILEAIGMDGRDVIATAVMVLIALAWIPVVQGAHSLYN